MTDHEIAALDFLHRCGPDCIGVIDSEEKMAAGLIYLRLKQEGYVVFSTGDNGPVWRITPKGVSALAENRGDFDIVEYYRRAEMEKTDV